MSLGKKKDEGKKANNQNEDVVTDTFENANNNESAAGKAEKPQEQNEEIKTDKQDKAKQNESNDKNGELEALNNRLLRLQADYLNFKARTEKEKLSTYNGAVSDILCDLLPVIDNFERAITADKAETDSFKEGVVMVYSQFMSILNKKGLKEIEALHKSFDHNLHYGVGFEESSEHEEGIVLDVLQKGYTVNDKLLRPAMVRICKK